MNVYHYGDSGREVPVILKRICFGILSRFLCISISVKENPKQRDPDVQQGHDYRADGTDESSLRHRFNGTHELDAERHSPDRKKDLVLLEEMLQVVLRRIIQENDMRVQEEQRSDSLKREWKELACVLDRLFLVIFLIIYACLTMSLFILDQN
ncbi:acetylcholine receptor subunit beta-like [Saccostrea echinata]|uniref:acetylcholine receptor subunit beta-like n=1 Tax=Saccostrea echinata TaxID=191078 RepID=UPI002A7FA3BB|nr:acetylcholine receptor subunit beta-like [Saccostrea echinata]